MMPLIHIPPAILPGMQRTKEVCPAFLLGKCSALFHIVPKQRFQVNGFKSLLKRVKAIGNCPNSLPRIHCWWVGCHVLGCSYAGAHHRSLVFSGKLLHIIIAPEASEKSFFFIGK